MWYINNKSLKLIYHCETDMSLATLGIPGRDNLWFIDIQQLRDGGKLWFIDIQQLRDGGNLWFIDSGTMGLVYYMGY